MISSPSSDSAESAADRIQEHIQDLGQFVAASPSSFHAVAAVRQRLLESGFTELLEPEEWPNPSEGGRFFAIRDGAAIAWHVPPRMRAGCGFHVFGAHTDSPGFKLKPKPTIGRFGWLQAGVEVYGAPLLNAWLDRELRLAGRLVLLDGRSVLTQTGPMLRFPQLAVHLDRSVNDALSLDRQQHMQPIWGLGEPQQADLLAVLAAAAGVRSEQVGGYDIGLADCQEPQIFGGAGEFFASGRLDNLSSVHAGLNALIAHSPEPGGPIAVLAAFDHEEVGSGSSSGAAGPFLSSVLTRISAGLGDDASAWQRRLASSFCLSADAGHAIHPNYPERHDPANHPQLNAGPVLKINANQRYATDALGAAFVGRLCAEANIPYQEFVSHNDLPCGSTIGPITATRLGLRTVDVGVPLLSMHSAREMCGTADPWYLAELGQVFFAEPTVAGTAG